MKYFLATGLISFFCIGASPVQENDSTGISPIQNNLQETYLDKFSKAQQKQIEDLSKELVRLNDGSIWSQQCSFYVNLKTGEQEPSIDSIFNKIEDMSTKSQIQNYLKDSDCIVTSITIFQVVENGLIVKIKTLNDCPNTNSLVFISNYPFEKQVIDGDTFDNFFTISHAERYRHGSATLSGWKYVKPVTISKIKREFKPMTSEEIAEAIYTKEIDQLPRYKIVKVKIKEAVPATETYADVLKHSGSLPFTERVITKISEGSPPEFQLRWKNYPYRIIPVQK